jgi:hypothetical protein
MAHPSKEKKECHPKITPLQLPLSVKLKNLIQWPLPKSKPSILLVQLLLHGKMTPPTEVLICPALDQEGIAEEKKKQKTASNVCLKFQ